jgi:hypothetical protein
MSRSRGLWLAASTSPDAIAAGDVVDALLTTVPLPYWPNRGP